MPSPRGIPLAPLTGLLDMRSSPDLMSPGSLRMRQNLQTIAENRLRRGTGWTKLLSNSNYNNEDYHDQLLPLTPNGIRQPVTLLHEAESSRKSRSLFVGKQGAIAQLDEFSGNYRIIGSGYGGALTTSASGHRFQAAQLGDYLAVTNDWEKPMYHVLEEPSVDGSPLLQSFDDLDVIGLTRAKVVWAWHNCLFFADLELDGERFGYKIIWSDYLNPASFDPAKQNSITGRKDLFADERVLAFRPFGNYGLLYTTRRIWQVSVVGGEVSFAFAVKYETAEGNSTGLLKYPNTLVAVASTDQIAAQHIYLGENGVYSMTPNQSAPTRMEWLHRSSVAILDDIDRENCEVHVAGINSDNELLISTASNSAANECPDRTLRANLSYQVADVVDVGFTAFCNYRSYKVPTIRDFIIANGICDLAGLEALGYGYDDSNEGLPRTLPVGTPAFTPTNIYTNVTQSIDLGDGGAPLVTEDWNQPNASEDSLCALLAGQTIDDLCRLCEGATLFVGASSTDLCLKQLGNVFYRETCGNPAAAGVSGDHGYVSVLGAFTQDGITSIIRFAPVFMPKEYIGQPLVKMDQFILDAISKVQSPPSEASLRIGISAQMADPNKDEGRIVWHQHSAKQLKWLSARTGDEHLAHGSMPSSLTRWNFMREGRVLYFELTIEGTGGDCELSGVSSEAEAVSAKNY